ncbi:putative nuclear migration protein [Diaporthe ampelina]|uniref:Putative nuclear migration protein n=1 Tax=Diaporthe ampelina TaxID=1214573 RepID=A0A0G2F649_9PEZI|nr:putative nuclear migration protein [Diaporthe ampelina]
MIVSNASSQPAATTVVDAIAQTMVGEWMFKYVRRRKSFGVANDNVGKDDSSNDRHKRWVWLAPYERAILWSSKQPSSGSALLGKSGRKLTIQSVLDVKDDNPAPKGHTVVFNRSILILTPQRALKFTAVNAERHYLWLTSLSFLAHSQQQVPDLPAAPAPAPAKTPDFDIPPTASESVASGYSNPSNPSNHTSAGQHSRDWSGDAAEPPYIPRFQDRDRAQVGGVAAIHGRKRSNTGGHVPPPLSFRGFSGPTSYHAPTNSQSTGTGSSEVYSNPSNNSHSTPYSGPASAGLSSQGWGGMSVVSGRTSEASNRTSGANFFDAIGTVRMEAFISPLAFSQFGPEGDNGGGGIGGGNFPDPLEDLRYRARRRSKEIRRRRSRSRQRDSYSSRGARSDYYSGSRTAGEEEYMRDDPFKGF